VQARWCRNAAFLRAVSRLVVSEPGRTDHRPFRDDRHSLMTTACPHRTEAGHRAGSVGTAALRQGFRNRSGTGSTHAG
jgi:hypothetical protein